MMRTINILFMALAMSLLSDAGFAEDYKDCKSTCLTEKESRNLNCPSPYDASESAQERGQCMKDNQLAYEDCVNHCPTPQHPSSSDEKASPPGMAY